MNSENFNNHLERLVASPKDPSLVEIMELFYKKPCRYVFPGISNDPILRAVRAARGSVIIGDKEVVLVIDPGDEGLILPDNAKPGFVQILEPTQEFGHGTTIICGADKNQFIFHLAKNSPEFINAVVKGVSWNRWAQGGDDLRHLKCIEQIVVDAMMFENLVAGKFPSVKTFPDGPDS